MLITLVQPAKGAGYDFAPCGAESDSSAELRDGQGNPLLSATPVSHEFCSEWNPEYGYNGQRCCSLVMRSKGSRRRRRLPAKVCSRERFKPNFCDEVTEEQKEYAQGIQNGKLKDVLASIERDLGRHGEQAYCTVNNGFLAWGRPLMPTATNRIHLRSPDRCTNYGTDRMVGLLEWTGHQVAHEFSDEKYRGVQLLVGDVAAPRGGCLAGRNGPKGHASHTTGQDADVAFIIPSVNRAAPQSFHTQFEAKANWWLVKQFFKNPYACVRAIFLDRKHIRALAKVAKKDEEWAKYGRFIRHMPAHKNHFHIRVGDVPGMPGCPGMQQMEDDWEEGEGGAEAEVDTAALALVPGAASAEARRGPSSAQQTIRSEIIQTR